MRNEDRIKHLKSRIAELSELLPYADGQAYYDDKRVIEGMRAELANLERQQQSGACCLLDRPAHSAATATTMKEQKP